MNPIVVGTDGSPGAANALRWASQLASVQGVELIVMTGFVPSDSELPPGRVDELKRERLAELESWSEPARLSDEQSIRLLVERGDVRTSILKVAERETADLVVVGRIGTSGGPGLGHIGSVASYLVHHSEIPIAIIGGAVNTEVRSILVGVDGSKNSHTALQWVADLAKETEIHIVAAAVHQPDVQWTHAGSPQNWQQDAEEIIKTDWASELNQNGLRYKALALRGSSEAAALLQAAKDERTDIIVVGLRGIGGFLGLRVGGVALKILHGSDRPVVMIPPARSSDA